MDKKVKHLEMIQGIVNRMSINSFLLKGWSVLLVSGLFALAAKDCNPFFAYLAFFPALVFWFLDGYFLWQEKLFRALYDEVRIREESEIDFSMDTSGMREKVDPWIKVVISKTLRLFHGTIVAVVLIVMTAILVT